MDACLPAQADIRRKLKFREQSARQCIIGTDADVSGFMLHPVTRPRSNLSMDNSNNVPKRGHPPMYVVRIYRTTIGGVLFFLHNEPLFITRTAPSLLARPIEALGTALNMKCGVGCRSMSLAPPSNVKEVEIRAVLQWSLIVDY